MIKKKTNWARGLPSAVVAPSIAATPIAVADPLKGCFKEQLDFILDPAKRKILVTGRQAGKTTSCKHYLLYNCLKYPGTKVLFVAMTLKAVNRIMVREIIQFLIDNNYEYVLNLNDGMIQLHNSSIIYFGSCDNERGIDKFRGPNYSLIIIDEAAFFTNSLMEDLIEKACEPMLMKQKGTLCLVSSPSNPYGYFYEAWKSNTWSNHSWSIFNNPAIPDAVEILEGIRKRNRWTEDNPTYRQEYLGEFFMDNTNLVYGHWKRDVNHYIHIPFEPKDVQYAMGVDFGIVDQTAITILAFSDYSEDMYLMDEFTINFTGASKVAEIIKQYIDRYEPVSVAADINGQGKVFQQEYYEKYGIMLPAAEKDGKNEYIRFLNDDVITGKLKIKEDAQVLEEWNKLDWKFNRYGNTKIENQSKVNHLSDSLLYNVRALKKYSAERKKEHLQPEQIAILEVEKIRDVRMERIRQRIEEENARQANEYYDY